MAARGGERVRPLLRLAVAEEGGRAGAPLLFLCLLPLPRPRPLLHSQGLSHLSGKISARAASATYVSRGGTFEARITFFSVSKAERSTTMLGRLSARKSRVRGKFAKGNSSEFGRSKRMSLPPPPLTPPPMAPELGPLSCRTSALPFASFSPPHPAVPAAPPPGPEPVEQPTCSTTRILPLRGSGVSHRLVTKRSRGVLLVPRLCLYSSWSQVEKLL